MLEQQSSILSEQELQLLASYSRKNNYSRCKVYSYKNTYRSITNELQVANNIEQLIFMLRSSPRGIALIVPDSIESEPASDIEELVTLLTHRADIRVLWLGSLPSMETNISSFVHCSDEENLKENITEWKQSLKRLFEKWLSDYSVVLVSSDNKKSIHQTAFNNIGLDNVHYLDADTLSASLGKPKLLIIDLQTEGLHLVNELNELTNNDWFPIIITFGELPANVCYATYTLIENSGFPVLATLNNIPDKSQWEQLFLSLFSRVYLKHWVSESPTSAGAYKLYHLEKSVIESYFCVHGMNKTQISALPKSDNIRYIIHAKSVQDWFPDGVQREIRFKLADELGCDANHLDICIEHPERILRTSIFFSGLVMARLINTKVYWWIHSERELLTDILKNFPVSDVILSESLSHQLIRGPSELLLDFLEQAQQQQINMIASLSPSNSTAEALALYGITAVISR
ncbi:hypothetical protein CW745_07170 [Psychromonas sp. psych-6C06]|uniref:hypothetical protein n=1 Tax=Psychromonas sp. psych-6C06 TaxID=2058089 RepID=UPI000C333950|nr:hypothetical protein [Psychromonas sp. psych-6C06]PKF62170.1 hypothetical protein CW745_07170 [Psychromonas sp. psych-6C06]